MYNNYFDILVILVKNRRLVCWMTAGFTVFALVLSLVIRPVYRATATLMPPVSQGTSLMSIMTRTNLMSDPEIGGTGYLPGAVTPSDVFAFMLKSGTVANAVIQECDLVQHYKQDKVFAKHADKAMYNVGLRLKKSTKIAVTDERFITISVEDKNKAKAAEISNKYADVLNRVYAGMTMTQGGKMREFIERRLTQEESLLKQVEDSLKRFQQRYKTISLAEEMKAVIEMSATLEAKIISQQIELDALKSYTAADNMQVKVLENQIGKAQQELNRLVGGNRGKTLFVSFANAPEVGLRFGQLTREVRIHQELYALLVQQLEQAKILEAKDTPKVQFLEQASPPYRKSWPKRSLIVLTGLFVGFMTAVVTVLVRHWWAGILGDSSASSKIGSLIALFRS